MPKSDELAVEKLLFACLLLGFTLGCSQTPVPPKAPPRMNLSLSKERLTVCQLPADAPLPSWVAHATGFISITRTAEELSIVCPEGLAPATVKQEPNWCAFRVQGPLDFGLTGILASVLARSLKLKSASSPSRPSIPTTSS